MSHDSRRTAHTYTRRLYRFVEEEAAWHNKVFPIGHPKRKAKIAAANQALQDLIAIKDHIKAQLGQPPPEQLTLIDTPSPVQHYPIPIGSICHLKRPISF